MADEYKQEDLTSVDYEPQDKHWLDTKPEFDHPQDGGQYVAGRRGNWCYPGSTKAIEYLKYPYPRKWSPADDDWGLPEDWKERITEGFRERLSKYRTFKLFMDICVRCGACADKCHFYLGSGDPKNMPVLRAELMRSVYRKQHTLGGKLLGRIAGARDIDIDVIKEWFYYFYQCTECRRCSVFCPYGIDTAEITMMGRELLLELGLNINWIMEPVANCSRTGNHLGIQPHAVVDNIDFAAGEVEDLVGIKPEISYNRKGAEILFVVPSADYFGSPHDYTFMGYLTLLAELGLDYTFSTYASEGGNFGLFTSHDTMKMLNAKIYHEAERLGVKWILGGECGHMWRVMHQYMDTLNGPAPSNLEVPVSPITGTVFENARSTKMVHICEFTSDLIKKKAIRLDPSRNDHIVPTFHDSCNPARGLGLLEEPRYVINAVSNNFVEMPENTIREQTFCCGGGAGLGTDENMEARLRGGFPRANAVRYVHDRHDVNTLLCICAIDKAVLTALMEYWVPEVHVAGIHELVGNALVCKGEKREGDLRGEPFINQPGGDEEDKGEQKEGEAA